MKNFVLKISFLCGFLMVSQVKASELLSRANLESIYKKGSAILEEDQARGGYLPSLNPIFCSGILEDGLSNGVEVILSADARENLDRNTTKYGYKGYIYLARSDSWHRTSIPEANIPAKMVSQGTLRGFVLDYYFARYGIEFVCATSALVFE